MKEVLTCLGTISNPYKKCNNFWNFCLFLSVFVPTPSGQICVSNFYHQSYRFVGSSYCTEISVRIPESWWSSHLTVKLHEHLPGQGKWRRVFSTTALIHCMAYWSDSVNQLHQLNTTELCDTELWCGLTLIVHRIDSCDWPQSPRDTKQTVEQHPNLTRCLTSDQCGLRHRVSGYVPDSDQSARWKRPKSITGSK